tara:strand:- start:738 stop:935 length:198 start_codon:yes stop_codon:yes gene_type:complete
VPKVALFDLMHISEKNISDECKIEKDEAVFTRISVSRVYIEFFVYRSLHIFQPNGVEFSHNTKKP